MKRWFWQLIPWRFWPSTLVRRWIEKRAAGKVLGGPFAGMQYFANTTAQHALGVRALLGSYESELHDIVQQLINQEWDTIVDIGAAEGYYAVGFARACPKAKVIAFEGEEDARRVLSELAAHNGVQERLQIEGWCDIENLRAALRARAGQRTLVMMDVEGAEASLLDPVVIPELQPAYLLIEVHDFAFAGLSNLIRTRFASTHRIKEVQLRPRTIADYPIRMPLLLRTLFRRACLDVISENRNPNSRWFYMLPQVRPTS